MKRFFATAATATALLTAACSTPDHSAQTPPPPHAPVIPNSQDNQGSLYPKVGVLLSTPTHDLMLAAYGQSTTDVKKCTDDANLIGQYLPQYFPDTSGQKIIGQAFIGCGTKAQLNLSHAGIIAGFKGTNVKINQYETRVPDSVDPKKMNGVIVYEFIMRHQPAHP